MNLTGDVEMSLRRSFAQSVRGVTEIIARACSGNITDS